MGMLPRRFVKLAFWSATISLILPLLMGKGFSGFSLVTYFFTLCAISIIWFMKGVVGYFKRKRALSKLGSGFTPLKFNRQDEKIFNKPPGFFSLIYQSFVHSLRFAFKHDDSDFVRKDGREMVVQYPINPNLSHGDHYHILGIAIQKYNDKGKEGCVLQGYCFEMKKMIDLEIDKIEQAFEYPSGLLVSFSE
jgi:hypothetical protein